MVVRGSGQVYQRVLSRLAQGLLHEERRVRYLSNEVGIFFIFLISCCDFLISGID